MSYADDTSVSVERSRAQLEQMVISRGAGQYASMYDVDKGRAIVMWTMQGRQIRLGVPLPDPRADRFKFRKTRNGYESQLELAPERKRSLWEQACRARWRAILLIVKAKFEAVEAGCTTFEREFLSDTVMADGQTLAEWAEPQIQKMLGSGKMPPQLMLGAGGGA